jgi:hypothetical protein
MTRTTATVVRVRDRVAARILHPRLEAGPNPRESRAVGHRLAERRRLTPSRTLQVRPSRPCEPQAEPSLQATRRLGQSKRCAENSKRSTRSSVQGLPVRWGILELECARLAAASAPSTALAVTSPTFSVGHRDGHGLRPLRALSGRPTRPAL